MILKNMFVVMLSLGAPSLAQAGDRASLEFIPVTVGLDGKSVVNQTKVSNANMVYLPSTPGAKIVVDDAHVEVADGDDHVLLVTLSEDDGNALKELTATHVGEHLAVMVEGQVVFTGQIKERLESNKLQISVKDKETLDRLVEALQ